MAKRTVCAALSSHRIYIYICMLYTIYFCYAYRQNVRLYSCIYIKWFLIWAMIITFYPDTDVRARVQSAFFSIDFFNKLLLLFAKCIYKSVVAGE